MLARLAWLVAVGCLVAAIPARPGRAGEAELEEAPAPDSVEDIRSPLGSAFLRPARHEPLFPRLSSYLKDLPPFFADTELGIRYRTYAMRQEPPDESVRAAWAMGGWVHYRSGWFDDVLALEVKWFTSQKIIGDEDEGGTLLLAPVQEGYSVLGVANLKLRYRDHELVLYRQELRTPYVNRQDSRMTPNTFEGILLRGDTPSLHYGLGYLWGIKQRNSDEFVSMSEAAGVFDEDEGLVSVGVKWTPAENLELGVFDHWVENVFNTLYAEASYSRSVGDRVGLRLDLQFTDQRSVGQDLLSGSPFETYNFGIRASVSWRKAVFRLGFSTTGDERSIFSPYGSAPTYVNLMMIDFDRADEEALLASLSYDFSLARLEGLTAIVNFVQGWNARDNDGFAIPESREVDLTFDYRIGDGLFSGLWLRLRGAYVDTEGASKNGTDFRVILNYDFSLL
jgi:hypothetical protein